MTDARNRSPPSHPPATQPADATINQRIFDTSQDLILVVDRKGTFLRVSPSSAGILGYAPDDMIGRSAQEFVHPDDLQVTRDNMRRARRKMTRAARTMARAGSGPAIPPARRVARGPRAGIAPLCHATERSRCAAG